MTTKQDFDNISYLGKKIDDTYKQKSQIEHVLTRPGMYIGNIKPELDNIWVYDQILNKIINKNIIYNAGLYKITDEILSNAYDQFIRMRDLIKTNIPDKLSIKPVKNIKMNIDYKTGYISIYNDGNGIDVAMTESKIYVPELIFSRLLTSTNYDDNEKRTTIGTNGAGGTLCAIFSLEFIVETVDANRKLLYKQRYLNNLSKIEPPQISQFTGAPYTKITYLPDYNRFGFKIEDIEKLQLWTAIERRMYDLSIYVKNECNLWFNEKKIKCSGFEDYVNLYIGSDKKEVKRVYLEPDSKLELCVYLLPDDEENPIQITFVNSAFTDNGGKHVDYLYNIITKKIIENYKLKKDEAPLKSEYIKKYMCIICKATINNPEFDSQTKRKLTTNYSDFGVKFEISDEFIQKIIKMGIIERAKKLNEFKTKNKLAKTTDGKKNKKIYDEKLISCEYEGTKNSSKAILILTEGDSAATFFVNGRAGLTEEEKKCYACFPLRGKILNTQKASALKIEANKEFAKIKSLIGLVNDRKYTPELISKELRYGRVLMLADFDVDGHHIMGLAFNLFHSHWPELIELGFICSFPTPLVKVWRKMKNDDVPKPEDMIPFYSEKDYEDWKLKNPETYYVHKYYKGLATHEPAECRFILKNKLLTTYYYGLSDDEKQLSRQHLEMVFKPKMEEQRKIWILNILKNPLEELPYNVPTETIKDFIDHRLINYCNADNIRSIPCLYDGLKPSQRKAIYAFLYTDNRGKAIKVNSLSGKMIEKVAYHHGEMSANETIINLAQNFIGATNLNLLRPNGSFGTRTLNGKDHGSARYITVGKLSYLDDIFNELDLKLLDSDYDDGMQVEPKYFMPIIPLVLLTGASGIGYGFSTNISCYNPIDVINNLKNLINGIEMDEMIPWFRGFKGEIRKIGYNTYMSLGKYEIINDDEIRITELPLGSKDSYSFRKYKNYLYICAGWVEAKKKKNGKEDTKDTKTGKKVNKKTTKTNKTTKKELEDDDNNTITTNTTENEDEIENNSKSFEKDAFEEINVLEESDIILIHIKFKAGYLKKELEKNTDYEFEKKMKLYLKFTTNNMNLFRNNGLHCYKSPLEIIEDFFEERYKMYIKRREYLLKNLKYDLLKINSKLRFIIQLMNEEIIINKKKYEVIVKILEENNYPKFKRTNDADDDTKKEDYSYLLDMKIDSVSEEKIESLKREIAKLEMEIKTLTEMTIEEMWLRELDEFMIKYKKEDDNWREYLNLNESKKVVLKTGSKPVNKLRLKK